MFDYLFTMMGPVGSSAALATVLLTVGALVSVGRCVGMRSLARPRF